MHNQCALLSAGVIQSDLFCWHHFDRELPSAGYSALWKGEYFVYIEVCHRRL